MCSADILLGFLLIDFVRELATGKPFSLRNEYDYFPRRYLRALPTLVVASVKEKIESGPAHDVKLSCSYCGSNRGTDPGQGWCLDCKGV